MLKKIDDDRSLDSWGLQELHGVIESSWIMKKTELLKLKTRELCARDDFHISTERERTVMKNLQALEMSHFQVTKEYETFCAE
jgi:hypothetical protein